MFSVNEAEGSLVFTVCFNRVEFVSVCILFSFTQKSIQYLLLRANKFITNTRMPFVPGVAICVTHRSQKHFAAKTKIRAGVAKWLVALYYGMLGHGFQYHQCLWISKYMG